MGKRSDFPRRKNDLYDTPPDAIVRLVPWLHAEGIETFAAPCDGNGCLRMHLGQVGFRCVHHGDILQGRDALAEHHFGGADAIIENPPWTRPLLHPLIDHFVASVPVTWLLLDAGWMFTKQSVLLLDRCTHFLPIARQRWIPDSLFTAKDDCCWYRFKQGHSGGPRLILPDAEGGLP
ncbi:hypothetical protein [Rhizobium mayense]|uniref:SAM-dependent methyltransferase n=1 Tax=Rhizobium mayense TaxID=1312184 RepID=A0ABT7JQ06_9HYPH|nr:hypothetical protein [Rhizobium mayense]MDL2398424.1 hypothetical protein [Rhizobium mayense]